MNATTESVLNKVSKHTEYVPAIARARAEALSRKTVASNRVLQCFLNSDMRNGHEGLQKVAKAAGLDVLKLEPGQFVIFINSGKDRIKLYAAHNVVAYYRSPSGRLDMRAIPLIPQAFQASGRIDYDAALKDVLQKALAKRNQAAHTAPHTT